MPRPSRRRSRRVSRACAHGPQNSPARTSVSGVTEAGRAGGRRSDETRHCRSPSRRTATRRPTSREREIDRLWPRVWQLACTLDHVANAGDWYEYRLGQYSVLIVRGDDGELRAFQNACRHRGSALCAGSGSDARRDPLSLPPLDLGSARAAPRSAVASRVRRAQRRSAR